MPDLQDEDAARRRATRQRGEEMGNENVGNTKRSDKQDQVETHSLPGTNQAGKGPDECDEDGQQTKASAGGSQRPESRNSPSGRKG